VHLSATITKDELVRSIRDLTPLRIDLGRRRSVTFGRPELVELVPNAGLRVRGDAKMVWEIAGLPLPVSLRAWQVLLVPSVVELDGGHVLAFDPVLEDLDFKRVPGLYRIIDAINEGVASQRRKLAWNLSRALSVRTSLMRTRIVPEATFTLAPVSATVAVTASEVRLDATLEARIRRDVTPAASLRSA
jgi:hypothetical protein